MDILSNLTHLVKKRDYEKEADSFENRRKLFILEGPDGVGKTTFARHLQVLFNYPIVHCTYFPDQNDVNKQFEIALNVLKRIENVLRGGAIFDRFIDSNLIYSNVFHDTLVTEYAENIRNEVNYLASHGVEVTYIRCIIQDKAKFLEKFTQLSGERDELYGNRLKEMEMVYDGFNKFWEKTQNFYDKNVKFVTHDITNLGSVYDMARMVADSKKK